MHTARYSRWRPRWLALGLWGGLLAVVLGGFGPARSASDTGQLMRWRDAGHDWLLVADDEADQRVVYDAGDGRPLRRLECDARGGMAALARRGGRLYVVGDDGVRSELSLPQLKMAASGAR